MINLIISLQIRRAAFRSHTASAETAAETDPRDAVLAPADAPRPASDAEIGRESVRRARDGRSDPDPGREKAGRLDARAKKL